MKRIVVFIWLIIVGLNLYSQIVDIDYTMSSKLEKFRDTTENSNVEILKNGFVDILSNGDMQASARLLKINIGNPNGFYMPFFIYTGASGNSIGEAKINQTLISNLLNPIGGSLNLSFNGLQQLVKPQPYRKINFAYQFGVKLTNGNDTLINDNVNFLNGFFNIGLFFQTGAWDDTDKENLGVFWVQAKIIANYASSNKIEQVFDGIQKNYFYGYSIDAGIAINKVINLKLGIYQFLNNTNIEQLKTPMVKLSLDYSMIK